MFANLLVYDNLLDTSEAKLVSANEVREIFLQDEALYSAFQSATPSGAWLYREVTFTSLERAPVVSGVGVTAVESTNYQFPRQKAFLGIYSGAQWGFLQRDEAPNSPFLSRSTNLPQVRINIIRVDDEL